MKCLGLDKVKVILFIHVDTSVTCLCWEGGGEEECGHAQEGYCYCYFIFSSQTWKILLESDEILQVHLFSWHEPMHASKSCTVQTATHQVWGICATCR